MHRRLAAELDFDTLMALVAAHAQTRMGRDLILGRDPLPAAAESSRLARLTAQVGALHDELGRLDLGGLDGACQWLRPGSPPPSEPAHLLDLLALARSVAEVRRQLAAAPAELDLLQQARDELPDTSALVAQVAPRLGREGQVPDEASPELQRLRRLVVRTRQQLLSELDTISRSHPGVVGDSPATVRRGRYCLPVRSALRGQMEGLLLDSSGTGATAYLEPYAVVELNNELVDAEARQEEEVRRVLAEIAAAFGAAHDELAAALEVLADLDAAQARVAFGRTVAGRLVVPGERDELVLIGARHPLLDERLHRLRVELHGDHERRDPTRRVVPLDFRLPEGVRTVVVSGPNAGGKTVVLKTVGLMVLMAAHGVPLPADEGTAIPRFDHIWCHVGDEQDVAADLSTFSAAMAATADLLAHAGAGSLVLYDELGAGTDPLEGAALGCALLEELTRRGCTTVASTHLAAIAMSAAASEAMDNAAMEYDEDHERPTFSLRMGRPGRSRGLEIAHAMRVPPSVLERARTLLSGQHLELDRWLRRLEQVEAELVEERTELVRQHRAARELEQRLETEIERLQSEQRKLPDLLAAERERLRRRAKERLDAAIEALEEATRERQPLGRRLRRRLRDEALDLPVGEPARPGPDPARLMPGTRVTVAGMAGEVQEVRGSHLLVSVAGKRVWIAAQELEIAAEPAPSSLARTVAVTAGDAPANELLLIGMDSESAREELERFLDHALTCGRSTVRVVHGHGTGALRRMVQETCRAHPAVRSFRHPPQHLGGTGATEVELEVDGGV